MASIFLVLFVILVAYGGFYLKDSFEMIYFTVSSADNGNRPIKDMSHCGVADLDDFDRRAFKTPTLEVDSIEECLRHGEEMNQPLVCRLPGTGNNEQKIIDAIFADTSTYEMVCRDGGDFHYPTHHRKINATIAEVSSSPSPCSAGFIYGDKHQALLQSVMPTMHNKFNPATVDDEFAALNQKSFLAGTSFASNFEEHRISTGSHAAMVTSMAYQLAGTKKWILHDVEESSSSYYYKSGWVLYPTCLADFLKGLKRPFTAVTGPGDILFFPYAWQHLVFTDPGANVMTNIRKVSRPGIPYLLTRFSIKSMVKVIAHTIVASDITGNPREGANEGALIWSQKVREAAPLQEQLNVKKLVEYLTGL